ncbi:MAG: zf-HC2 domain-containing protein [Thiobacillus sp.]|nr:zf-HC2 domain-containing protein [Thiobacillus sp.]
MKWLTTCRETTVLASRAQDGHLTLGERMAMHLHLAICANCARFARQLQAMRRLLRADVVDAVTPGLSDAARRRIENELQKKLET